MMDNGQSVQFPVEFLNSIEISELPPHCLQLKIGTPVLLMRSLKPPELINGTRCIVVSCNPNVAEVKIAASAYKEWRHFIPRIPLEPSNTQLPVNFQRRHLPLRPCFAMTMNKAQGQTLKYVGLDLRQPVFTHGVAGESIFSV
ncbi:ATP-dependent DNA helicase pif1 [Plakobranchus ocellatus]|uniref:ATP-dependent DNA helicase pif1 n=1 Tax=Plakobranchus ocellatus TaxID=259542 RepID=A0AAV4BH34_9GAST|nr:ATP-dependent DNA helicase pif1 [Plakobranchus ocellatus]